jgi:inner membrane protein
MDGAFVHLEAYQGWLILGLALGIAEIVMPGIFLIWVALAAAITGVLTFILPIGLSVQIVIFAVLCVVSTYIGRRMYAADPGETQDPLLNDRTARLIGEIVTVSGSIEAGRGRVKVGDSEWPCKGPDMAIGARAKVIGADGSVLLVEAF